jgi:hypothetical protein
MNAQPGAGTEKWCKPEEKPNQKDQGWKSLPVRKEVQDFGDLVAKKPPFHHSPQTRKGSNFTFAGVFQFHPLAIRSSLLIFNT